ncbi:P18 [Urbanus proteus nucleopolyhedrovirus]|uniref:P18 n=1 Tax=Urbanus proteus nucleopolyhedrovirus TaxID=1675866 RepID=A0A162GU13_9ABAC|nr:P18 [Urbanus proteus nucleopolyhedrovirus]AKR17310.1 P18 [Urbanus proteus nucleopolyhedrovirus]
MTLEHDKTVRLYLCDMPDGVTNDKIEDDNVIYFEGIIECFDDETCNKFSFFSELKKEEALFMRKMFYDLLEYNNGNFCKNHVLIDALIMYKTYAELIDESAFGNNILESCVDFITNLFRIFRLNARILVVLSNRIDYSQDNLSALLKHLSQHCLIEVCYQND